MTQALTRQLIPTSFDLRAEGGLAGFVQFAHQAPMLSAEEERDLATRFRQDDDLDAASRLVVSHLRHVIRVARGFAGYGLAQADLIQEGNIGLMKAVKHFDPMRGVRLVSFAVHWIRAEIYDFVLQNWRIVKVATTKAQRKLFFNLRKKRSHLGWMSGAEVDALAEDLDVDRQTVLEMEGRLGHHDTPFDADTNDDRQRQFAPAAYLEDMRFNPEALVGKAHSEDLQAKQLAAGMQALDERSRSIVQRRWLAEDKTTLRELAEEYGVSAERIRQIEKRAIATMKDAIAA